jgi:hypothetical protein
MTMMQVQIGDIVCHTTIKECVAGVVTGGHITAGFPKIVFFEVPEFTRSSAYAHNRGWFTSDLQLITDPTDQQIATATHILLTGYMPGVDDE